jgi:hypothetical protein
MIRELRNHNHKTYKPHRITTDQSSQKASLLPWASRLFLRELAQGSPEDFPNQKHVTATWQGHWFITKRIWRILDEKQGLAIGRPRIEVDHSLYFFK